MARIPRCAWDDSSGGNDPLGPLACDDRIKPLATV